MVVDICTDTLKFVHTIPLSAPNTCFLQDIEEQIKKDIPFKHILTNRLISARPPVRHDHFPAAGIIHKKLVNMTFSRIYLFLSY